MRRRPPSSTRLPYTTLFRSRVVRMRMPVLVVEEVPEVALDGVDARLRLHAIDVVRQRTIEQLRQRTDLGELRQRSARDRKSTRLNSIHLVSSYAVFCLKKTISRSLITAVSFARIIAVVAALTTTASATFAHDF